jgi:phage terminase large subunit
LKDMILRLGLHSRFKVTKEGIVHRVTGSEFIFKGLHNNEHGIRSMEGIDICWVEEAQSVGASSWRSLTPTVFRKQDAEGNNTSEIWVTYNLINEGDATHHRFVTQGRNNALVFKVNYDSNPYFPAGLREEMEDDKANDYHLYEHIWLGMPLKMSNAIIFSGRYRVQEFADDLWKQAERVYFGLDFGFAQDPNALERFFILDNKLYIEYEAYATGVELDDLPDFLDRVPGTRDWPIKADCSRPETISYLRRQGFAVSGAEKWEGCVKDGIQHIRKFDAVVIHPRCTGLATEAPLYRFKVDPHAVDERGQPLVLPLVVDKFNHGWDAVRYGLDGHIQRCGEIGMWAKLGKNSTS